MIAVQIGANRGYDHFTQLIQDKHVSTLILVEPFADHNNSLQTCYSNIKNKYIENIIISSDNVSETKTIYYHEQDGYGYGNALELASLNKQHCFNIRSQYEQSGLREIVCTNLTINKLFEKYSLSTIDLLAIDTEGHDKDIIQSIDFTKYIIKELYYENLHSDMYELRPFLSSKKYKINENVFEGWSDHAILQL